MECASKLLEEAAIVAIPGIGFGKTADSFVRFALTVEKDRVASAESRLAGIKW